MESKKRKPKSVLINPKFQWTLIGYAASVSVLILASVYALLSFAFQQFVEIGLQAGLTPDHVYFQFIQMQETTIYRVMIAIALVVGLILIVGGLVVSHKIAGPIYRMQRDLLQMSDNDPLEITEVKFRKGDFFPELPEAFNQLVTRWKHQK